MWLTGTRVAPSIHAPNAVKTNSGSLNVIAATRSPERTPRSARSPAARSDSSTSCAYVHLDSPLTSASFCGSRIIVDRSIVLSFIAPPV